jgi:siderophore synthetase component
MTAALRWDSVSRELIAKAITELTYEDVIAPRIGADGVLSWVLPSGTITATARRRELGWWRVDANSLHWNGGNGETVLPDAAAVLAEGLAQAGVHPATLAQFVVELSATLAADVTRVAGARPVRELVDAEPVLVEAELGGHPWIIANKGRLGFSAEDAAAYPPEARRDVHLRWLAAMPERADVRGLDHHDVIRDQVGAEEFNRLRAGATAAGIDPDTCVYLPVHPWQWANRIATLHAGELARGELVELGVGAARYRPQLAIRTLTDIDHPDRRYLKLPMSVLNTSVYRGLPRERTLAAPALTSWLHSVVQADPFLAETGVVLLGEVASVSVSHPVFNTLADVPYQHTEMLGAIWRESVAGYLRPGERAVSLAALLHVDAGGASFTGELIARSGLAPAPWFERLHQAVLPPLLHVLYKYGTMFSPHGQNCMIIHRDGVPQRLVVKDFVDDVALCSERLPEHDGLSPDAATALADVTIEAKTLVKYLHGGLIVGVYRYLAEIAADHLGLSETSFWDQVRSVVTAYQAGHPELADRFVMFDLESPTFPKLCLNRLRLFERGYADDPERPVIAAQGDVPNPLARDWAAQ